jgi:hypothetical protein
MVAGALEERAACRQLARPQQQPGDDRQSPQAGVSLALAARRNEVRKNQRNAQPEDELHPDIESHRPQIGDVDTAQDIPANRAASARTAWDHYAGA